MPSDGVALKIDKSTFQEVAIEKSMEPVEMSLFDSFVESNEEEEDEIPFNLSLDIDMDILIEHAKFMNERRDLVSTPMPVYRTSVELLNILKVCNTPLYMFDKIMEWATKAKYVHQFDFIPTEIPQRESFINSLKTQFNFTGLEPHLVETELPGSKTKVNMVLHDFKACFYSLLNDPHLMHENNLLIDLENIFADPPSKREQKIISDVNTGDVWRDAHKCYVLGNNSELLCPIIFFIDKTHTDLNGRLCIEQIRFTLGIFKLHVRNQSRAWRTLGYIMDQSQISTNSSYKKMEDYQAMTSCILQSFIVAQKKSIGWKLVVKDKIIPVFFRIPVLFIIGDTDGHDKLVGKYGNRTSNVKRLCRYCDCPYEKTDDPYYEFGLYKRKEIVQLIANNNEKELKEMSYHCVPNAWSEVLFCDNKHGIYSATPAEIMHCLQKGLYEYMITALFSQKQIKKQKGSKRKGKEIREKNMKRNVSVSSRSKNKDDASSAGGESDYNNNDETIDNLNLLPLSTAVEMSKRNVFSEAYAKSFDRLTRRYGKYLMHQSNRDLPRTHFYTNYTSTGYKNASELTGMIIVFLMVFSSNEGDVSLDINLGEKRSSQYIHLFELMLMVETFCKTKIHERKAVLLFKKMIPSILDYYKNTVDRQEGNGMKIIKYHLALHFADDIFRFGSMANYDSSIGESHHKAFAKKPAKNTQRRKEIFEAQTAQRQIDSLVIDRAYDYINPTWRDNNEQTAVAENINKNKVIEFCGKINNLVYTNAKKTKRPICNWKDKKFYTMLGTECSKAIKSNYLKPPIRFFTQHNRSGNIFRADPQFHKKSGEPWYDWVMVDWGNEDEDNVPAKLLLFMEIDESEFMQAFKFGESYIESPGAYAIAYSFATNIKEPAHLDSRLVTYGKILTTSDNITPILYVFDVNCIADTCIAVPYNTNEDIVNANEWLLLQSKDSWYNTFIDFMEETLNEE